MDTYLPPPYTISNQELNNGGKEHFITGDHNMFSFNVLSLGWNMWMEPTAELSSMSRGCGDPDTKLIT